LHCDAQDAFLLQPSADTFLVKRLQNQIITIFKGKIKTKGSEQDSQNQLYIYTTSKVNYQSVATFYDISEKMLTLL